MAGTAPQSAFLRQLPPEHLFEQGETLYALPLSGQVVIGREPGCQVVLNSQLYAGVSRRHAQVCTVVGQPWVWQVCDLESTNGTFLNGKRIRGCQTLQSGDRLSLGRGGAEFIFETRVVSAPDPATPGGPLSVTTPPTGQRPAGSENISVSMLFPILSSGRDLARKAYLLPGLITVSFVVMMFLAVGHPQAFNFLLALYLAGGAFYFVYQLCGKPKPWWVLVSAGATTVFLLITPVLNGFIWLFREVLPGTVNLNDPNTNLLTVTIQMFFGAGLMEELLKAIPVLLAYGLGRGLRSPLRQAVGVWEPLDGILLGTASAVGFTLLETLGQYVPSFINDVSHQAGVGIGQVSGLHLLIARILGSIAGHLAYSGYLGYFIGLSVLKPKKRWQILLTGYLTAAALHTLWNVSGLINLLALALVGSVSYAFLTAAILKARSLSPTRSRNFATRFSKLE